MIFFFKILKMEIIKNSDLRGEKRKKFFLRAQADIEKILPDVKIWIDKIQKNGDAAVVEYTKKFDDPNFSAEKILVKKEEIAAAKKKISPQVLEILQKQISISRKFHEFQAKKILQNYPWEIENVPGVRTGVRKTAIDSVALYVPAGKAPLPTVAQILTVAAAAARVPRIAIFFPPTAENLEILVAADLAGAHEIYRVGGIAAIAAAAIGTKKIPRVEKICGPGSPFVQAAKMQVFGKVGIDMISGPSEELILADENARADWIAADVLARLEHGPDSACPIVTNSENLAKKISAEIEKQKNFRLRKNFIFAALENNFSKIILVDSIDEMIDFANEYAAEHLHIQTKNAEKISQKIRNAGSIFVGKFSPVPVGDYASGANHSLPTARAVKFSSPIGVETFLKSVEFQILTKKGLQNLAPIVDTISQIEGLEAHNNAIKIRLK